MFCKTTELVSESDVEQKFVLPMLTTAEPQGLGFGTEEICTKHSIRRFEIDKGSAKKLYYPDYAIVLAGLPVLVIEVKPPEEDVFEGLREARLYANELNALYPTKVNPVCRVIATNGLRTVSCMTDTTSSDVDLETAAVTLLTKTYAEFTQLAGRSTMLKAATEIRKRTQPQSYSRALAMIGGNATQQQEIPNNTFGAHIASDFRHIFNPTSKEDRRFIAKNAYIPSQRRHQYVDPIDRIIRAAVPPSVTASRPLENSGAPSPIINALKRAKSLQHEVMLLVGSVGSGKTTFIDYLQEVALSPDVRAETEWLHISMNDAPLDASRIYTWLTSEMVAGFLEVHPEIDFEDLPAWELIFSAELNKFKRIVLGYIDPASPSYGEKLSTEMQRLQEDPTAMVNAMIRTFCVERGRALILVLDNCDKRKLDEQLLMFQVAQWARATFRCVVFLPIRDVTYDLYRTRPPLDTTIKDLVFRIEPPMFSKVLARRIGLALEEMSKTDQQKRYSFKLKNGIAIEYPSSDRAMYLVSISRSLFEYDRIVRRLITALAGRDVRKAMELFLEFCTSGHISENDIWKIKEKGGQYVLEYDVVVRVLLRMNRRFYDGRHSYIKNLLQCDPLDAFPDHFVRVEILKWLQVKFSLPGPTNVNGYHQCRTLTYELVLRSHSVERI